MLSGPGHANYVEMYSTYLNGMMIDNAMNVSALKQCLSTVGRCSLALRKFRENIGCDIFWNLVIA
jgi:hypothetical protein